MDAVFFLYVMAGAVVGFAVGVTGVGGGSLMTPLLLLFNIPPNIAIGTDLLFAAITKSGGIVSHQKQGNIRWSLVAKLAAGSIPAALLTSLFLGYFFTDAMDYTPILTSALGIMLVLTSCVIFFRQALQNKIHNQSGILLFAQKHVSGMTILMGILLGVFVTLSSVGAGAIGAAVLMMLYPHLATRYVVGVDIAHAVPLTFIAGFAHLLLGNVDFVLLGSLLVGSLPAIYLGASLSRRIPNKVLQPILALILMVLGVKFVFF